MREEDQPRHRTRQRLRLRLSRPPIGRTEAMFANFELAPPAKDGRPAAGSADRHPVDRSRLHPSTVRHRPRPPTRRSHTPSVPRSATRSSTSARQSARPGWTGCRSRRPRSSSRLPRRGLDRFARRRIRPGRPPLSIPSGSSTRRSCRVPSSAARIRRHSTGRPGRGSASCSGCRTSTRPLHRWCWCERGPPD